MPPQDGCEACCEDAELPFENILDRLTGSNPTRACAIAIRTIAYRSARDSPQIVHWHPTSLYRHLSLIYDVTAPSEYRLRHLKPPPSEVSADLDGWRSFFSDRASLQTHATWPSQIP
jgi:hypothetical protein